MKKKFNDYEMIGGGEELFIKPYYQFLGAVFWESIESLISW